MKLVNGLFKWVVIWAAALSTVLLAIILLSNVPWSNPFILRMIILSAAGFFGGLTSRILFRKWPAVILILFTLLSNTLAILVIDFFYETSYQLDFIMKGFKFQIPSISDGSQIVFVLIISLLPLLLFRRRVVNNKAEPIPEPVKTRKTIADSIKPLINRANPMNWKIIKPKPKVTKNSQKPKKTVSRPLLKRSLVISGTPKAKTRIKTASKSKPITAKPAVNKLKIAGKWLGGNGNDVKLVGEEEHVCPYCLEEVKKGDKNGVVICPECGTWHHQDCWNLTGSCGVAHRNEL